jgi:ABC-type multidrug transport system ATPase subunit
MTPFSPPEEHVKEGPVLHVEGLAAGYRGRMVVNGVSLELAAGEVLGLVGRNGSGKSTLLLGLAGLTHHTSRTIQVCAHDCSLESVRLRRRAGLGILLQRDAVFPDLSVETNLTLAGPHLDLREYEAGEGLYAIASDILRRKETPAGTLSGGERRILGLLMAISGRPRCLLVDEPTLGLSVSLEIEVFDFLRAYARKQASGIVLVSHNLGLVQAQCDRACILREGRIEKECHCGLDCMDLEAELTMLHT